MTENTISQNETIYTATVFETAESDHRAAATTASRGLDRTDAGPVVVLGGIGKTGRRVVARLAEHGIEVRAASRSTAIAFDWTDRTTWDTALHGARSVYLAYQPDLAAPGADEAVSALTEAARRAGVRRLVLLSGRGEPEAQRCEEIALRSGLATTVVRCSWFAQNFSEDFLAEEIAAGQVTLPADAVAEPFVDAEDIADVAVAALTEDGHAGEIYELTGPRALTFAEAVATIAAATGREIGYQPVGLDEYAAAMSEMGLPREVVDSLTYLFGTVLDGRNTAVTDGVERALGRAPRSFADYARRTAAEGGWPMAGGEASDAPRG
ncbi:NAD(P)H-binding protein [Nocardia kruczakiae]|uniref:NAD(P)H-binding protein n=1 Tax=Nocardia kruczakiae TaxID=261477 RepID=UPI000A03685D|nr:NAD(P)H-binding protein [Nocardia kruczakiae]